MSHVFSCVQPAPSIYKTLSRQKDGSIRVCLDPRPLNRAVRRAQYSLPTVPELAVRLRGATVFSVLDARCGFWMIQIDDASADLCTFSTPFGRYQFLRLPYGISCAPEVFHARLRQHLVSTRSQLVVRTTSPTISNMPTAI